MSGLGQFGAARIAPEQLESELLLERLDLMADRGTGDAKFAAGEPEGAKPCRGLEGGQSAKRREIAAGQESSPQFQSQASITLGIYER